MVTKRKPASDPKRDAARTQSALVESARWLLTRHGYDQLGIREIARQAGVDASLVQRYFGSKKKLFEIAIDGAFGVAQYIVGVAREGLPGHLARVMVSEHKDRNRFDPTLVLLRSATSAEVQQALASAIEQDFVAPLAERIGGTSARTRSAMALAILGGFDLVRAVLGNDALEGPEAVQLLERVLTACLREDASAAA